MFRGLETSFPIIVHYTTSHTNRQDLVWRFIRDWSGLTVLPPRVRRLIRAGRQSTCSRSCLPICMRHPSQRCACSLKLLPSKLFSPAGVYRRSTDLHLRHIFRRYCSIRRFPSRRRCRFCGQQLGEPGVTSWRWYWGKLLPLSYIRIEDVGTAVGFALRSPNSSCDVNPIVHRSNGRSLERRGYGDSGRPVIVLWVVYFHCIEGGDRQFLLRCSWRCLQLRIFSRYRV